MRNAKLFAGTSHLALAQRVATHLGAELAPVNLRRYTNRETTVDLGCSVREKDVYILQSGSITTNDHFMEALIMVSAAKLASARKITVVMPYFPYSKQSKKKKRRGAITGKLVASMLTVSGADHIITMDLHASQMTGFFTIPVDNLFSEPTMARWLTEHVLRSRDGNGGDAPGPGGVVIVAKNAGGAKRVTALADRLGTSFALIHTDNAPSTRPFSRAPSTVALHTLPQTPRGPGMFASAVNAIPITSPRAQSPSPLRESLENASNRGSHTDLDLKTIVDAPSKSDSPKCGSTQGCDESTQRSKNGKKSKSRRKMSSAKNEKKTDPVESVVSSMQRASFYVSPLLDAEENPPEPEELDIDDIGSPNSGLEITEVLNRSDDDDDDDVDQSKLLEMVNTPVEESFNEDGSAAQNFEAIAQAAAGIFEQKRLRNPNRLAAVPIESTNSLSRRSTITGGSPGIHRITSGTHLQSDPPLRPPVAVTSWHKKRNARITLVGDVRNKLVLLLDDMIDHPSSFLTAAEHLMMHCGAQAVYIVASHGLFSGSSLGEVEICPYVHKVIVTNSFPIPDELTSASTKLVQIDVAPLLAEAIRRNHNGESISYLFDRNPW
ncbi:ribose-phosphate pyrophosphokinase 1 [Coemansia spiralis]|uniref:ribose-phosphate diphosphokinase n=2 Tax=Coemansia TaxID=4863 RepID=A0A9W8L179_9FUNG|nr:ribose-phosphate pyrophosphokinase 1 [Coemansia umbellata]KAJ2625795.1 ribose-phosphate pyrophosphokinase 1 [Coemansia sp. RSA 1358]KAJ2680918.1 ribose-phosphate pyrophosphokinase 1 [Coemansia spiralis]